MNLNMTPAELAQYDQYIAGTDETIDKMVTAMRLTIDQEGETAAMAYLIRTMIEHSNPVAILGVAAVAVRRLAMGDSHPLP